MLIIWSCTTTTRSQTANGSASRCSASVLGRRGLAEGMLKLFLHLRRNAGSLSEKEGLWTVVRRATYDKGPRKKVSKRTLPLKTTVPGSFLQMFSNPLCSSVVPTEVGDSLFPPVRFRSWQG